jgi:hypothetical protein
VYGRRALDRPVVAVFEAPVFEGVAGGRELDLIGSQCRWLDVTAVRKSARVWIALGWCAGLCSG